MLSELPASAEEAPPPVAPAEPPPLPPPAAPSTTAPVPSPAAPAPSAPAPRTGPVLADSLETPPDDHPLRQGFTFGLGLGLGLTAISPTNGESKTEIGLAPLSFDIGAFASPNVAIFFRGAGTSFMQDEPRLYGLRPDSESVQYASAFYGVHVQYWFNDRFMLSGGPGAYIFAPNPLSNSDVKPVGGFGASVRAGYAVMAIKHHVLRFAVEAFPAKYENAFVFGSALNFEWQYF